MTDVCGGLFAAAIRSVSMTLSAGVVAPASHPILMQTTVFLMKSL